MQAGPGQVTENVKHNYYSGVNTLHGAGETSGWIEGQELDREDFDLMKLRQCPMPSVLQSKADIVNSGPFGTVGGLEKDGLIILKLAVKKKWQACIPLGSFGIAQMGLGLVVPNKFDSGFSSKNHLWSTLNATI